MEGESYIELGTQSVDVRNLGVFGINSTWKRIYLKRIQTVVNLCDLYGNILWTCELDVLYVV